ncbi:tobamovirus multiplication protein 1-like [Apium graveolens]|uniref:tobamovirus multiplication protein 1-like n=1 Tax=Apium graveolens TaxID=4045 RepID=UPI003D797E1D
MLELRDMSCYEKPLVGVNIALAFVDALIALIAFSQLIRIHTRNSQVGWTRQKVFHLMIGLSNLGYFLYFVLILLAACKGWLCWSSSCGFTVMAFPGILFLAAFLLLLSFWVDICHQNNDDEDEEEGCSPREALLEKMKKPSSSGDRCRRCCSFRLSHIGSRQKVVLLVTLLIFALMVASSVLMWLGMGEEIPIDSLTVSRVYKDVFAIIALLVGGALAGYGLVLSLKMRKVRSESAASEMWKVAGLAIISVVCFMSTACIAIFTDIPLLYSWNELSLNGFCTSLLLVLYYFIGSSVPSAFVLWVMRELPPSSVVHVQEDSAVIAFINDDSIRIHPQHWTASASMQNQASRASPI